MHAQHWGVKLSAGQILNIPWIKCLAYLLNVCLQAMQTLQLAKKLHLLLRLPFFTEPRIYLTKACTPSDAIRVNTPSIKQ